MDNSIDIEHEIENDFMKWNKKNSKGLIIVLIFSLSLIIFFRLYSNIRAKSYIWQSKTIHFVEFEWQKVYLSDVEVVKIPDRVYDAAWIDNEWADFLFSDIKNLLFVYWDGCPYARAYESQINKVFSDDYSINNLYLKNIIKVPKSYSVTCHSEYCPRMRIGRVCSADFCIINPMAKEIVVDSSHDEKQISVLLKLYADRNDNELL